MDDSWLPDSERTPDQQVFGTPAQNPAPEGTIIEGAEVAPPLPVTVMARRSRRARWAIALSLVLVVVLVSSAMAFFMVAGGSSVKSETTSYVPENSVLFMAGRMDLPGNQRDKVAAFLSHFPGGRDSSSFTVKYDRALDDLLGAMSNHQVKWTTDLKDWMGDEISVALTSFSFMSSTSMLQSGLLDPTGSSMTMTGADPGVVAIVSIKDKAKAEAWVKGKSTGETYAAQQYGSYTINATSSGSQAYAFTSDVLILGTTKSVKASLDAKTKGSIEKSSRYQAAMKALKGDRIGWFYLDMKAYMEAALSMGGTTTCASVDQLTGAASAYDWASGQLQADSDNLTLEVATPHQKPAKSGVNVSNHTSQLAAHIPKSAMMSLEIHSLGSYVTAMEKAYSDPKLPAECKQAAMSMETALQAIGGGDWMGDAAAFMTQSGNQASGALVIVASDQTKADLSIQSWTNALSAMGNTPKKSTYKGVKITSVGTTPSSQIELGRSGNLVIVGIGQGTVASVVDTTEASSLASLDRYKTAMTAAGPSNVTSVYLDIPNYVKAMLGTMTGSSASSYNCEIKPYVNQLDAVAVAAVTGSDADIVRVVLTAHGTAPSPAPCN